MSALRGPRAAHAPRPAAWLGAVVLAGLVGLVAELALWQTRVFHAGLAEMPGAMPVYVGAVPGC